MGAATQLAIDISTAEGQQTGLRFNSVIQGENLLTYDQALILRVLGRLSATASHGADEHLSQGRFGHSIEALRP
jgi:hypothetical protein